MATIDSTMTSAVNGMRQGISSARRAASQLASGEGENQALLELKQSEQQVKNNAETVKTANEALGSIVDVQA